jgi:hypothetical protein
MYLLILALFAIKIYAISLQYFLVPGPVQRIHAEHLCYLNNGNMAEITSGPQGTIYGATRFLHSQNRTRQAWIKSFNYKQYNYYIVLRKPEDFETSDREGDIVQKPRNLFGVCDDENPVLCVKTAEPASQNRFY